MKNKASGAHAKFLVLSLILGAVAVVSGCASSSVPATATPATMKITTTSVPNGTVGVAYSASITASGGVTPYTYSASNLPGSFVINSATGAIIGTPTQTDVGQWPVTLKVSDSTKPTAQSATASLTITVKPDSLKITTTTVPSGTVGVAYSASITASGGITPYTYSASNLPSTLAVNSATGAITGTPAQSAVGTTPVVVKVSDSTEPEPQSVEAGLSLTVNAATTAAACSSMSTGVNANLNGFLPFPATRPDP